MITTKILREHNACRGQVELFEKVFPEGCEPTNENIQTALDAGLDIGWAQVAGLIQLNGVFKYPDGCVAYYKNGRLHRDDGPAVVWANGREAYWKNGLLHRDDGPAVVWADGRVEYWKNNRLHRDGGPAIVWADGSVEYWKNGQWQLDK